MNYYKFNVDVWIMGNSEKEAGDKLSNLLLSDPDVEDVVSWECIDYEDDSIEGNGR